MRLIVWKKRYREKKFIKFEMWNETMTQIQHKFSTCSYVSSSALMSSSCCLVVHSTCCSWADSSCSRSSHSFSQCSAESFVWAGTEERKTSLASSPSLLDQEVWSFWRHKNYIRKTDELCKQTEFSDWSFTFQRSQRPSTTLLSCCCSKSQICCLCFISNSWYTWRAHKLRLTCTLSMVSFA